MEWLSWLDCSYLDLTPLGASCHCDFLWWHAEAAFEAAVSEVVCGLDFLTEIDEDWRLKAWPRSLRSNFPLLLFFLNRAKRSGEYWQATAIVDLCPPPPPPPVKTTAAKSITNLRISFLSKCKEYYKLSDHFSYIYLIVFIGQASTKDTSLYSSLF